MNREQAFFEAQLMFGGTIKKLQEQITELQKQLEEKKKEIEKTTRIVAYRDDMDRSTIIKGVKFSNEQIITLQNIDYFADKQITKLKQQLAGKTLDIERINKAFIENRSLWKGKYDRVVEQLKSQPKEIVEKIKRTVVPVARLTKNNEMRIGLNVFFRVLDNVLQEYQK